MAASVAICLGCERERTESVVELGFQDSWRERFPIHSGISDKRAAVLTLLGLLHLFPLKYMYIVLRDPLS